MIVGESPRLQIVVNPAMHDRFFEGDTEGAQSDLSDKTEFVVECNKSSSLFDNAI